MANVLSLAMKINADASGFKLDPVQRALVGLGTEADKVTAIFDKFKGSSQAAAAAQERLSQQSQDLLNTLRDGGSATEYAAAFERLTQEARDLAAAFEEGARVSDQYRTTEERRATELERLQGLAKSGAISEETYARALAEVSGSNEAAAKAERDLSAQRQSASKIIEANLTGLERAQRGYDAALAETQRLEQAGLLTATQANAERQRQSQILERVTAETERTSTAAKLQTLQFNELSGVFAALPGPLGSIAGRISGLSSAAEGLSRVFSGGLRQGFASIGASLSSLINPLTVATAGVASFGAAARSVALGLTQLEDRVEKLGNTADKLGVSFQFVQVLDEAARRSGTSIDSVSAAFGRLQKSVLGVDEESKAAQASLAQIGVTAEQLQALKPEDQYLLIGQRIAAIEDPARRAATSINLFGRAGADLLPFFRNIAGAADDISRVGSALGTQQRRDIDEFGGAMDRLTVATRGAGEQILASFAPAGKAVADALSQASGAVAKFAEDQNNAATFSRELQQLQLGLSSRLANDAETALLRSGKTAEEVLQRVEAQAAVLRETGKFVSLTDGLIDATIAATDAADGVESVATAVDQVSQLSTKGQDLLTRAIQQVVQYGQAGFDAALKYQEALREVDALIADEGLTEQQAAQARANVTAEYERQIDAVKLASDEKRRAADETERLAKRESDAIQSIVDKTLEQLRIERDFGGDSARARNAADLQRISEDIAKTEAAIANTIADGDKRSAASAVARLAQLDQVREALAEAESTFSRRADEVAQGFSDGFSKAFEATAKSLDPIIKKAAEFGNEGAKAAQKLQEGIASLQQRVPGILSAAAYQIEVNTQRKLAEERIAQLDRERQARLQAQQEAFQQQVDANNRVQEYLKTLVTDRARLEAEEFEKTNKRKIEAAQNLKAIEDQIATQQRSVQAARESGQLKEAKARQAELNALEKLKAAEKNIVDGKADANRQINAAALANANAQAAQQQQFASAARQQIGQIQTAASSAIGLTNEAFAKAADRQRKLFNDLNTLGSRTVQTADARTAEGAAIVLGLAANAQDPRLIEQRLSNKVLKEIAVGLTQNLNRIGIPAVLA